MLALRREAHFMVNKLPEKYLAIIVRQMREYSFKDTTVENDEQDRYASPFTPQEWKKFMSRQTLDPHKTAAYARLEKLINDDNRTAQCGSMM